jgi:DNA-directed RNA polymerase specialized sigma24 family protein
VDIRTLDAKRQHDLWRLVFRAAKKTCRSDARAKDLTQKTFARLHTTSPWTPGGIALEAHLLGILQSVYSHEAASDVKRVELERRYAKDEADLSEPNPSPEGEVLDQESRTAGATEARLIAEKLRAKIAGRQPDLAICDFMADGITKPAQLAVLTGIPAPAISEVVRRLRRTLTSILAAERGTR